LREKKEEKTICEWPSVLSGASAFFTGGWRPNPTGAFSSTIGWWSYWGYDRHGPVSRRLQTLEDRFRRMKALFLVMADAAGFGSHVASGGG